MDIRNKTVVVTGAGRGIGRAIALQLASHGAEVALFDLNTADLEETGRLCAAESVQARGYRVNVADEGEVSAAMTRVVADFGRLDGLVNNAGVEAMGVVWAKELARYGIRVGSIAPGFTHTEILASMRPEFLDKLTAPVPLKRLGRPEEIAHAVLFIFENDFFTGRCLEVDGGLR